MVISGGREWWWGGGLTPEGTIFGYDFNTVLYAVLYSWGCMLDVFCLCAPAKKLSKSAGVNCIYIW